MRGLVFWLPPGTTKRDARSGRGKGEKVMRTDGVTSPRAMMVVVVVVKVVPGLSPVSSPLEGTQKPLIGTFLGTFLRR